MKEIFSSILLVTAMLFSLLAQAQNQRCGQVEYENFLRSQDPNYDLKQLQVEQEMQATIVQNKKNPTPQSLYTIPVVIHVLYNTAAQNLSDAELITAIDMLNQDFRRQNTDAGNTPSAFQPMAADMEIQFCLASVDPAGNPTTGIIHKSTSVVSFSSDNKVKFSAQGGDDVWDATKYMNIWVCNLGSSLLGYGQFPGGSNSTAGVVTHYKYTGPNGTAPYNLNRSTMTHEIGHYFNLRHIWGDANCGNDQCADTPTSQSANYGCPAFPHVTCSNGPNGDMFMNFMDYTDDACMNLFTQDQKARAQALMTTTYASLATSAASKCTGGSPSTDAGIVSIPYPNGSICTTTFSPQVNLINFGTNTLTSCVINYSIDGNPVQTYNWSGSLATGQPAFLTLSPMNAPTGTHTFVCYTSNPNNTTDSNPGNDQLSITFASSSQPSVSVSGNTFICTGESTTLSASGANSYSWSTGSTAASITVSPTATTTYSVTGSNGGSCTDTKTVSVTFTPGPVITIDLVTNVSSCVSNNGAIDISVTGGSGVYAYQWTPGNYVSEDISGLSSGLYAVSVTDPNGCVATANTTVTNPAGISASLDSVFHVICNGNGDGKIFITPIGGATPYTFAWSNGATTEDLALLPSGTYSVLISDANSCSFSLSANVTQPGILAANAVTTNITCAGNNNGAVDLAVSGGTPPYAYIWNPGGQSTEDITGLNPGNYSVTITDKQGCTTTSSAAITSPSSFTVSLGSVIPSGCNFANGSISLNVSGGIPAYTYVWIPSGGTTSAASGLFIGTYSATVTDANGCSNAVSATVGDSCDYVWPGDANDDGIATNMDIIAIGIGYGSTGTARSGASLNWIGQPCTGWADTLANGTNYKHIDCNGDGIIDDADTLAVVQNYGLTHNNKFSNPVVNANTDMYTQISTDSVGSGGSLITVQIGLGTATSPATNVYGVAYSISFSDASLVDLSSVEFSGQNSWLGTLGTDLMAVGFPNGDAAVTRIDQANVSGNGFIHTMKFKTSNTLNGSGNSASLVVNITNATVISADETIIPVNQLSDSLIVQDSVMITSMNNNIGSSQITLYPNPTKGEFTVSDLQLLTGSEIIILNLLGETVYQRPVTKRQETVNLKNCPAGIYFMHIRNEDEVVSKKIVKE